MGPSQALPKAPKRRGRAAARSVGPPHTPPPAAHIFLLVACVVQSHPPSGDGRGRKEWQAPAGPVLISYKPWTDCYNKASLERAHPFLYEFSVAIFRLLGRVVQQRPQGLPTGDIYYPGL